MAKAVLVMDMPEDCEDCPLFHRVPGDVYCSGGVGEIPIKGKPDWCPLIYIPERIKDWLYKDTKVYPESFYIGYRTGFNACLDALEGKHETD